MATYDLVMVHRVYPKVSREPAVFSDNKFELVKFCVNSIKNALGGVRAKIIVLFDNCPCEYESVFGENFNLEDLEFIHLTGIGNLATFGKQIDILLEQDFSEVVYFSEDDYYYLPGAFSEMIHFLDRKGVDFVSPYDHLDYYKSILHAHKIRVGATGQRHWKTANSTCLTFMTKKKTLFATRHVFQTYLEGNQDSSLWLSLTKEHVLNPVKLVDAAISRIFKKSTFPEVAVLVAWYYCWRQILFGEKFQLWTPMPTLGIHLEKHFIPSTEESVRHMICAAERHRAASKK